MKLTVLTKYGRLGASTRLRTLQYLPYFRSAGMQVRHHALISDEMLLAKYAKGRYGVSLMPRGLGRALECLKAERDESFWIEKELLPYIPSLIERGLLNGRRYILDYDDAIFHNYDAHRMWMVRTMLGSKIDELMRGARAVVVGNAYLADRAVAARSRHVEIVPTVVDSTRYKSRTIAEEFPPRIVWIGSPSTGQYLEQLVDPLRELAKKRQFILRVIGVNDLRMPGVDVECHAWSEVSEAELLSTSAVGLMPLADSDWEKGKCGYKIIQYMASGLPVVATPVGANTDIVADGITGFLAKTPQAWVQSLSELLADRLLRERMGIAGRLMMENKFSLQSWGPRLAEMVRQTLQ